MSNYWFDILMCSLLVLCYLILIVLAGRDLDNQNKHQDNKGRV